jgi:flavin reductase (DIM6/NTAB) family NADH-FMN oxidoreductase RutF
LLTGYVLHYRFIEAANYTAIDAPSEVSEWLLSGLTPEPSIKVKPARVQEAAVNMECELGMQFIHLHAPASYIQIHTEVVSGIASFYLPHLSEYLHEVRRFPIS